MLGRHWKGKSFVSLQFLGGDHLLQVQATAA
jgi:hypothetical protein